MQEYKNEKVGINSSKLEARMGGFRVPNMPRENSSSGTGLSEGAGLSGLAGIGGIAGMMGMRSRF